MGLFNFGKKESNVSERSIATIRSSIGNTGTYIKEVLKGLVDIKKIRFPVDLGEAHPFDYDRVEKLVKKYGILSAVIDKHVDFMMSGGISVKTETKRAEEILNDFMKDFEFDTNIRVWLRQAFAVGFSPLELSYDTDKAIDGMKILKASTIYVNRTEKGVVEGFKQYTKDITKYNGKEVENFKTFEIADLNFNVYGDEYYGLGIIYPAMTLIDNVIGSNKEMHTIMKRKANNPIIFVGGDRTAKDGKGEYPDKTEMDNMGSQFEWLNNKHEWTITDFWKPMTLDFGNIGDKFQFIIDNDVEMLYSAVQIPSVIMGKASVPEGLAKIQMDTFQLRIQSLREHAEKIIENKIFKPVLISNGIEEDTEVEWGLPSQDEKDKKSKVILEALKNFNLNPKLADQLQMQLAELMGINPKEIVMSDKERKEEEAEEQPIVPGSNSKGVKTQPPEPKNNQEHLHTCNSCEDLEVHTVEELDGMKLKEFVGFNYSDYEQDVLMAVNKDNFEMLRGVTNNEIKAGLLNSKEISKLRVTLYDGFLNNKSVATMSKELGKRIDFKDRYRLKDGDFALNNNGDKILSVQASNRAIMITRSEVVRLSNKGAINNYIKNDIEEVRWVSALSTRTCPQCESLNGIIFEIGNQPSTPLHPMCRCSLAPVVRGD